MSVNKSVPDDRLTHELFSVMFIWVLSQAQRFSNAIFYSRHLVGGSGTQRTQAFVETSYHARFVGNLE